MYLTRGQKLVGVAFVLVISTALGQAACVVAEPITWQGVPPFGVPGVPPLVRFTGTLLPPQETYSGVDTLSVSVEGKDWIFRVNRVQELTGSAYGQGILGDIFPPQLRFVGPDELLAPLQQADITEQRINVEGRLYVAHRMLFVTAVKIQSSSEQESS